MARESLAGARIGKSFGGLRVLHEVGFSVAEGEIVALIGPNGAGKTTLFNVISGLVRPSAGSLRLGARELVGLPAFRISRLGVGRTFQTPRPFLDLSAAGQCPRGGPVQRACGGGARGAPGPASASPGRRPRPLARSPRWAGSSSSWGWRSPWARASSCSTSYWRG